jgi:hypothetical protein
MTNLSDYNKYYRTDNATALASNIESGKTAYVNGGLVTGTAQAIPVDGYNGVLLDYSFPLGQTGSYTPSSSDALVLEQTGTLSYDGAWDIETEGYVDKTDASDTSIVAITGMPAKTTSARKYEMWGKILATPTDNTGVYIQINRADGSNRWFGYLAWQTGSNRWVVYIAEQTTALGWNARGTSVYMNGADLPIDFHLIFTDRGDTVTLSASAFETDTTTDNEAVGTDYYTASRSNKTVETAYFTAMAGVSGLAKIKGCKVTDI